MPALGDIPLGHLDGAGVPPPAPSLDAGGFQSCGPEGDSLSPTHEELQHLSVVQALHSFTVNMSH